jgi:amino acid adenylation domain-containing protein/non-ribosomal peptide synthase protein (TIGR01720 family)
VIALDGDWEEIGKEESSNLQTAVRPEQLAYVIYTSGSTGKPKGVMIEHGSVVNLIITQTAFFGIDSDERILQFSNYCFDASVEQTFLALFNGGTLIMFPEGLQLDAKLFDEFLFKQKVSHLHAIPTFLENIQLNYKQLKRVIAGGDVCSKKLAEKWGESINFYNEYGPTETTVTAVEYNVQGNYFDNLVPIGKPLTNVTLYILNSNQALAPVGVQGEIYIGGVQVARGYLNLPELTAERFIKNPFSEEAGSRLYKTGDLGRWLPDGNIEYLGRADDQVKIRGYRIELGEIGSLLNQSGLVKQGVVLAKEDSSGNKRLVGYVVPQVTFDKQVLQNYLSTQLPDYMIPALWVELDSIPLMPNGKINRKALPDPDLADHVKTYVAPRNEIETALSGMWRELLGLGQVGIYDNFFELGGDSILTIQVVSRMRRLGYLLRPKDIFNYQEIAGLSAAISRGMNSVVAGEQGVLGGSFGLVPIQSRYLERESAEASHFNQSILLKVDKGISIETLQLVLDQLTLHHDALRLIFKRNEGIWHQEYGTRQLQLDVDILDGGAGESLPEMITSHAGVYQRSLSIEEGILMRMALLQTAESEDANRLLIVIHHLAIDGVSWRILLEDLEHMLNSLQKGKQVSLGAKGSSYRQWYSALVSYGSTPRLFAQKEYWERTINGYKPLPQDKEYAGEVRLKDSLDYQVRLGAEQTRYLLQEVPKVYHTEINDLLLAALGAALCEWSGDSQVVIGLEGHGREAISPEIDSSRTVGWFTSLYPVLLKADNDPDRLIKEVKEELRQIPDKGLGYGVLKYINKAEGLQGRDPWDIIFNYLGQLDTAVASSKWIKTAAESKASGTSEHQAAASKLSVNSSVSGGELILRWSYSSLHYNEGTISKLAENYIGQLQRLIGHCLEQGESGLIYTPSDYGLGSEITYQQLDRFLESPYKDEQIKDHVEGLYRLSGLQHGMLFHGLYDNSGSYTEQFGCDLVGVNVDALVAGWSAVISHHSILRSAFYYDSFSIPVQCVFREVEIPLEELDYRGMGGSAQKGALEAYEAADHARGFDFKSPPLMRLCLIRLDEDRYRMLWTFHHILFDGWSMQVLIEEFLNTYEHLISGQSLPGTEEDQYGDYIRYLECRDKDAEEYYWRNYLQGISHGTLLPFIRTTRERTKGRGEYGSLSLRLDGAIAARIQGYAQSQRLTVNTLMQGVWALLLHRYTGSDEVIYGVVVSGRPDELQNIERRVGMYINTLVLKAEFGNNQETVSWLHDLQADQVSSRQYQYTALQDVQGWTGVKGDMFDSLLIFENYPVSKLISSKTWSLQVENVEVTEQTNYPLTVTISSLEEISISFSYNTELLEQVYVEGIRDQFEQMLLQMTEGQADTLSEIRILTAAQEHTLLIDFNATQAAYPKDKSIVDLFEEQVKKSAESIAIVFEEDQLTYKELNARSNQLARYLQKIGVKAETLVPICVERSLEMIIGILGILKAGGAYVPIDPEYPQERIGYMLEDTGANLVVSSNAGREKLNGCTAAQVIALDGDWEEIGKEESSNLQTAVRPEQLAYVIYTSGSTGKPKGVMIEHGSVVNLIITQTAFFGIDSDERILQFSNYCFDASVEQTFLALFNGGALIMFPEGLQLDVKLFDEFLFKQKVSHLHAIPTFLENIQLNYKQLKRVIAGGDVCSKKLAEKWGESINFYNEYGPTETTVTAIEYNAQGNYFDNLVPIGKPLANVTLYILNSSQALTPIGVQGEIYIGGVQVARGYLNLPELTAERFIKNPFSEEAGSRLYKTGDLGRWLPDGNIEYLGRADDQVKIRGYRIELGEIENVLNESGLVKQGVVLAKEDSSGNKRLVGYVVPQERFDKHILQNYLSTQLPDYMVPALWVELDSIPLMPNGKIDRKALPDPDLTNMVNEYVAPRTATEIALAKIWQELLGLERIGIYDDFFELGGHSLLAMRIVSYIKRDMSVSIPIRTLFRFTSISDQSKYLDFELQAAGNLDERNTDEFDLIDL